MTSLRRATILLSVIGILACHGTRAATWIVSSDSVGPIRFGMTPTQAAQALGLDSAPYFPVGGCDYWIPPGAPAGLSLMVEDGIIVRVDVDSVGTRTVDGVQVGSQAARVRQLFSGRLIDDPHKYQWDAGWRYLSTFTADSARGLVFEVDSHAVRSYRAGLWPPVGYVEHCN